MNSILLLLAGGVALNVYALVLVLLRAPVYRVRLYRPMILNLALSAAPAVVLTVTLLLLSPIESLIPGPLGVWAPLGLGGVIWLLLLPNSAYLITELNFSHRRETETVPLWFDIVSMLALALSGVMNTLLNILLAQLLLAALLSPDDVRALGNPEQWVMVSVVLFLVAIGIYLGRYLRFNTWDLLLPVRLIRKLIAHLAAPGRIIEFIGFCVLHTLLFAILYAMVVVPVLASL